MCEKPVDPRKPYWLSVYHTNEIPTPERWTAVVPDGWKPDVWHLECNNKWAFRMQRKATERARVTNKAKKVPKKRKTAP